MRGLPVFDAHCDTISRCYRMGESLRSNSGMVSLELVENRFEHYCQFFALFSNVKREGHPTYGQLLECFREELSNNTEKVIQCRTGEDAELARKAGKTAAFLTVEGGELLDCDPMRLSDAAAAGVVAINLTWNHANALSGSCREETQRGLSEQGRCFVHEMERLRILVDVSHLSDPGFWDLTEIATRPILASHSNARAVHKHPRNLTDDQIKAVIRSGGVVGLNFYRDFIGRGEDFDAVYAHLEHFLELGGARHIGLGGDWDGCDTISTLPTVVQLHDLYEYLLWRNYSENILRDLFYNNMMRVVSLP